MEADIWCAVVSLTDGKTTERTAGEVEVSTGSDSDEWGSV